MAAFSETEIDWRLPDVSAILQHQGLLAVLPSEAEMLEAWLVARNYELRVLDCARGLRSALQQLGELFQWVEQFGYRLEDGEGNLNALRDGFSFPASSGSRTALLFARSTLC